MRIGDLDYMNKTKGTGGTDGQDVADLWNAANVSEAAKLTEEQQRRRKWKNWWYYYKWYVICGIILLGILINVAGSRLGWWTKAPDLQIAYVGKAQLPQETVSALEQLFASLASDFNEDGAVIVKINQYTDGLQSEDPDTAYYEYASEISLIGDISDCDSYFFLMDDPVQFQREYQLLACPDGSCPGYTDYEVDDKVILWADCPLLAEPDLGSYSYSLLVEEISGNSQELLSGLFLGRRCFFDENVTEHVEECAELWDRLCGNAR